MRKETNKMNRRIEALIYWIQHSTISHRLTMNKLFTNILIYSSTNILIFSYMQNKPNFTLTARMLNLPHGSRATGHESRFIQNEPNFTPKEHAIRATSSPNLANNKKFTPNFALLLPRNTPKSANFYTEIPKKTRTFPLIYPPKEDFSLLFPNFLCKTNPISPPTHRPNTQTVSILPPTFVHIYFKKMQKLQKRRVFFNFWNKTHLTPCTTRTYKAFHPKIPFKRGIYPTFVSGKKHKTNPISTIEYQESCIEKMQNEPNLNQRATRDVRRETK